MWIIPVAGREQIKMRNWELDREAERRRVLFPSAESPEQAGRGGFAPLEANLSSLRDSMERVSRTVREFFGRPAEPECC